MLYDNAVHDNRKGISCVETIIFHSANCIVGFSRYINPTNFVDVGRFMQSKC